MIVSDDPGPSNKSKPLTPVQEPRSSLVYVHKDTIDRKLPKAPTMAMDEQGYVECKKLGPVGKSKHKYRIQLPDESNTVIELGAKGFSTTKATAAPAPAPTTC